MRYDITHTTTYDYTDSVSLSHHVVRLQPRNLPGQRCRENTLEIQPHPAVLKSHVDYYGNRVSFVTVEGAHRKLVATSRSRVEVTGARWPAPADTPAWEAVRDFT